MNEPPKVRFTYLLTKDGIEFLVFLVTAEEATKLGDIDHALNQLRDTPLPIVVAAPSGDPQSDSPYEFFGPVLLTAFARHNIDARTQWQDVPPPLFHLPWHT